MGVDVSLGDSLVNTDYGDIQWSRAADLPHVFDLCRSLESSLTSIACEIGVSMHDFDLHVLLAANLMFDTVSWPALGNAVGN